MHISIVRLESLWSIWPAASPQLKLYTLITDSWRTVRCQEDGRPSLTTAKDATQEAPQEAADHLPGLPLKPLDQVGRTPPQLSSLSRYISRQSTKLSFWTDFQEARKIFLERWAK